MPGDVGICVHCAGVSIYGDGLVRRVPTEEEQRLISDDADMRVAINAARLALAVRKRSS